MYQSSSTGILYDHAYESVHYRRESPKQSCFCHHSVNLVSVFLLLEMLIVTLTSQAGNYCANNLRYNSNRCDSFLILAFKQALQISPNSQDAGSALPKPRYIQFFPVQINPRASSNNRISPERTSHCPVDNKKHERELPDLFIEAVPQKKCCLTCETTLTEFKLKENEWKDEKKMLDEMIKKLKAENEESQLQAKRSIENLEDKLSMFDSTWKWL